MSFVTHTGPNGLFTSGSEAMILIASRVRKYAIHDVSMSMAVIFF